MLGFAARISDVSRYTENTSEWTLDYPPFFAYFELALARVAACVDPAIVTLQQARLQLPSAHRFLRWSVIGSDSLLLLAASQFCRCGREVVADAAAIVPDAPFTKDADHACFEAEIATCSRVSLHRHIKSPTAPCRRQGGSQQSWVPFVLVVTCPALLLVDHVHFQYNGLLLGVLLLSINAHLTGAVLLGGTLFAALLNLKHLYLVLAPVHFVFILRSWVWGRGWVARLLAMGAVVAAMFGLSLGPFIAAGQLPQLLRRCDSS